MVEEKVLTGAISFFIQDKDPTEAEGRRVHQDYRLLFHSAPVGWWWLWNSVARVFILHSAPQYLLFTMDREKLLMWGAMYLYAAYGLTWVITRPCCLLWDRPI